MGGTASSTKKSFAEQLDYIAAHYITTQNFQDMIHLASMEYCNKLVIITSDVLHNQVPNADIEYLWQKQETQNGKQVDVNKKQSDNVLAFNLQKAPEELDVKNKTQKRRMCISIAKRYVLIAHLFAAIITTVNPSYSVKGRKNEIGLQERSQFYSNGPSSYDDPSSTYGPSSYDGMSSTYDPSSYDPSYYGGATNAVTLARLNLCSKRLNAVSNSNPALFSEASLRNMKNTDALTIKPEFCSTANASASSRRGMLSDEPGFPELEQLYNDQYNDDQGGFNSMSPDTKQQYLKDVETVYKAFTNKEDMTNQPVPQRFRDIKLRDFGQYESCITKKGITLNAKDEILTQYADQIRTMLKHTDAFQAKLLDTIELLFKFDENTVRVNPALSESDIQRMTVDTRRTILELYTTCEQDYLNTVNLFEAVVHRQAKDTTENQTRELEKTVHDVILQANN